jgi:hypothetical protein
LRASRKFESPEQSLVRIEAAMSLRNALSAASAGVAPWPTPPVKTSAGLAWRWPRVGIPILGSLALLAAGLWIPMSTKPSAQSTTPEEPQAWQQLSAELDQLTKEEVVDETSLEETRKRLEELRSQEEDQWFSHSSLEATDSLRKSHRAETERVERELDRAAKALAGLEKHTGAGMSERNARMADEFDQALQGLQNGAMKPNPQLLEQMRQLDLKDLGNLSPEQLQQLRENLQQNADALKECQGSGEDWLDELLAGDGNGNCEKPGEGPGKGGVNRGPGHDPNVLGQQKDPTETGDAAGLQSKDLSHTAPGDLLELQDGEHEVDPTATRLTQGGSTEATGEGGSRVWREALDPDEQRTLKRFFE